MYVVCLLFYAIGGFNLFLYLSFSPFPECSEAPLGEGRLFYFAISWRWTLPGYSSSHTNTQGFGYRARFLRPVGPA